MKMLALHATKSMIRAMVPEAKAMVLLAMVAKIFLILMLMNEAMKCDWVVIFYCNKDLAYLNLNNVFDLHRVCAASVLRGLWIL
jgi:hypothetical protein